MDQQRIRSKIERSTLLFVFNIIEEITTILAAVLFPEVVSSSHWATAVQSKESLLLSNVFYLNLNLSAMDYYHKKSI